MKKLITFLTQNPVGFLATVDGNQPRVRPFGFQFFEDNRFYFLTSNKKAVYGQLMENAYAEFSSISDDWLITRVKGSVAFTNDLEKKKRALDNSPVATSVYQRPDNPELELMYIHDGEAILFALSGSRAETFRF